jgi:hypothetical protein
VPSIFSSYAERVLAATMKRRGLDRIALAALRKATELLGLAIAARLAAMRENGSPVQALMSRSEQDSLHLGLLRETILRLDSSPRRSHPSAPRPARPGPARLALRDPLPRSRTAAVVPRLQGSVDP